MEKPLEMFDQEIECNRSFYGSKAGIIYAIVVLLGNGVQPIINNARPLSFDPLNFTWMLSLIECLCVLPFFLYEKVSPRKTQISQCIDKHGTKKDAWKLFLAVGGMFSIATILYTTGLSLAGSINGSIALKSSPIYAIFVGALYLKEKINKTQLTLTGIMLIGLYYQGTRGTWLLDEFNSGFLMLIITTLFWTIAHAITKPFLQSGTVSISEVIFYRTLIVLITVFSISIGYYGIDHIIASFIAPGHLLFAFYMGSTYFLMHACWYKSITSINLSLASALVIPSPAITTILAMIITQEPLHSYQIIGMAVMMIGLYALMINKMRQK